MTRCLSAVLAEALQGGRAYCGLGDLDAGMGFVAGVGAVEVGEQGVNPVVGDVAFGRGVVIRGSVTIEHRGPGQLRIDDGTVLEG